MTNWVGYSDQLFFSILSRSWHSGEIGNKSGPLVCGQVWAAQTALKQLSQLPTMGGSGIVTQKQSITGSPVANICAALPPGLGHLLSDGATSQQEETAARRGES